MTSEPDVDPMEASFLAAIADDPDDDGLQLVYADWLEERGRIGEAEFLRTTVHATAGARGTFGGDLAIEFQWSPPGTFTDKSTVRQVEVTHPRGYWMGLTHVSTATWLGVMGPKQSWFENGSVDEAVEPGCFTAIEFCEKLTERERQAGRLPAGWEYRLSSIYQWLYACHLDESNVWDWGEYGWFTENSNGTEDEYSNMGFRVALSPIGVEVVRRELPAKSAAEPRLEVPE